MIDDKGNPIQNGRSYTVLGSNEFSMKFNFTIDKKDVKQGNKILIGTLQETTKKHNQSKLGSSDSFTGLMLYDINLGSYDTTIMKGNDKLGYITCESKDNGEADFYLNVTLTKDYATDPNITFAYSPNSVIAWNYQNQWAVSRIDNYTNYDLPDTVYIITPNQKYSFNIEPTPEWWSDHANIYQNLVNNPSFLQFGKKFTLPSSKNNPVTYVIKIQSDQNLSKSIINTAYVRSAYYLKNNNTNNIVSEPKNPKDMMHSVIQAANGLSPVDLLNSMKENTIAVSHQNDGSLLLAAKVDDSFIKNPIFNDQYIKEFVDKSYAVNVGNEGNYSKEDILNNTLKYYRDNDYLPISTEIDALYLTNLDTTKPHIYTVTDVTPNQNPYSITATSGANNSSFNAELYKTTLVHYLDSSNKDSQVANDSIMGIQNQASNYQLNIPKGYILDTKSGKNKDGTQYKWSDDKKSIAYTFNEDQKLNDANPINIYITHGTHNTNDNSGKSTRTIQYTGLPDNLKPKDNVQTVLFKRSGVTDDVSGETTYGDWQPQSGNGHYTAVPSPTFAGYKPDQEVIPDTAATPNKNETVTVNYNRTNQHAKLTVHDDTANTDLNDYAENSTGLYQDQINFKTAPSAVEQELKDRGYTIVSDSFKDSPTYNADDSKNNFAIHVTHKIVPVTPDQPKTPTDVIPDTKQHYPTGVDTNDLNKDVQRSIFYKYEDNTQAEPTVVQKAHFDRTVKVDAVTQKIVDPGNWATKDNYPEVTTKSIDGYTPDKTKVDSATPSMINNQDQTVVYHANDEDAAITYIDDTTGKVLKTDTQKAKYKQTIKFTTDPNTQIQAYKDQGYVLVSSNWKDGSTYQTDPTKNKFTVHLKHGTSTVTPDNPKTPDDIIPGTKQHYPKGVDANDLNQPQQRQITYTYADSKKQASSTVTQKATFHRTATVDNVTGKTTYTDWTTSDQYPEVKSPTIEGYTPDRQTVPVTKPVLNTKQDVAITYNPNPEQVDVIAQDNTGKQLSKSTLHGNYNTDYTATTPVIKGYHLIKMPANTHGTYKTHNDPIIYIYTPDSNSVPEQTDGTPKPDKSSYPNDLTPAKRSNKLPETGSINLVSELNSALTKVIHNLF